MNSKKEGLSQSLHLNKDWLYEMYIVRGLSTYEIAAIVGRNPKNVYNKLKDFGIPTRSRAEVIVKNSWWNTDKEHPNKGKPRKPETKAKISASRKGKVYVNLRGEKNGMYGKRSHNWKGGTTPERQRLYTSTKWKEIIKSVFVRDGYICQRCGEKKGKIHAHHIKTWAECVEGRMDTDNLITVCKECHLWIHSKKNTNKDFLD